MKKIFIAYGHHNTSNSFNSAIRDTFIDEAKKIGHKIDLINLGPTISYGYPKTYEKRKQFTLYCNSIWNHQGLIPEIVLIDGRFRVACFLTCLLKAKHGTKLIFDDYVSNPHYHIVEEFLKPKEYCGRQALFIVPRIEKNSLNEKRLLKEIKNFQYVLD